MSTELAASKQHVPGGSPQDTHAGGSPQDVHAGGSPQEHLPETSPKELGRNLPPAMALPASSTDPRPAAKMDVSPSASSAATLALDFWVDQMDVDDDGDNTLKHNPPRDVTLAYADFLLSQPDDGQCHCQWVTYCGKWELWQCRLHKYQQK